MDNMLKNLGGVTLKSLLENPSLLQVPSIHDSHHHDRLGPREDGKPSDRPNTANDKQEEMDFEKKLKEVEGDYFAQTNLGAAFLGPNLWDKTYGHDDFKLEYMELDEFLSENGLPFNTAEQILDKDQPDSIETPENSKEKPCNLLDSPENQVIPASSTTPDGKPSHLDVNIQFDLSPTDIALATVPGQNEYDPRTRCFSEEELKPQPMIKKSRKIYVPHEAKDDKYWDRRKKNNIAAKRSRDARRIKENQISMRAAFLEKENNALKDELAALKTVVKSYEHKLGIQ